MRTDLSRGRVGPVVERSDQAREGLDVHPRREEPPLPPGDT